MAVAALVGAPGCSPARYQRAADKEVYRIIQSAERQIFGHTNEFKIDTRYSGRKPAEIPAAEIIDDRQQTNRRLLTLEAALGLAVTNSRDYQQRKELLYLDALALTGERYEFSPHFFSATSEATFTRDSNGDQTSGVDTSLTFGQLLRSGGRFTLGLANTLLHYYTGNPGAVRFSSVFAELAQPIFRGFGARNPAVEALTQAERNVIYAIRSFGFFQNQNAIEIVDDYFRLLAAKDEVRNGYTNYLSRVRSTQRLQERAVDREKVSDVGQTRQAELRAKNDYVNAVVRYQQLMDAFKIRLGLAMGERLQLDDSLLRELATTGLVPVELNPDAAFRLAVNGQLEILTVIDRFEDSKRKVMVAADQLKPGLNLFANATLNSQGPNDYTRFDPDEVRTTAGATLDLPFSRLAERNQYRRELVAFESQLRTLSLELDELKRAIEGGLRTLNQRKETYAIQQSALAVANSRVEGALANLEAGRAEVRELVEAQDAQISAQNSVTRAVVDYLQARLELMLTIGLVETDSPKFWLKDHVRGRLEPTTRLVDQRPVVDSEVVPPDKLFEN